MIKQWINQLSTRERYSLIIGTVALVLILVYFMLIDPFINSHNQLKNIVAAQKNTLDWMNKAAPEVQALRQQSTQVIKRPSLLSLIDKSTRRGLLSKARKRIQPKGEQEVRVSFENVLFTELIRWLGQLYNQYQVQVTKITIERQQAPDRVKVRLTLKI